jgi:multidrug efflux system outer membrane protein
MRSLFAAIALLALPGCVVGPDYERPPIQAPEAWRTPAEHAADVADAAWWDQFGDPVLSALIADTVRGNKDLVIATANVERAYAQYGITRSALYPQLDASASAARERAKDATFNDYAAGLTLGFEIDLWGRIRRATEAARADALASEEARRTVVMTLVGTVAAGYVQLRALDRQLGIARQTSQYLGDAALLQRKRFEGGLVPESDYRQAESAFQSASAQVPELERLIARQENFLSVLAGRNPGPIARGRPIEALAFPAVPAALPSSLLERRPDIRQAEEELIAANANIGVAKAAYLPRISLTGALGFESVELSSLVKSASQTGLLGVGVALPIFNAGRTRNQVLAAEASKREAVAIYERSALTAFQEVENALVDRAKLADALEVQSKNVAALTRFRDLAALRYREGATIYLEVANAEQALLNAQLTYVGTQSQLFQSYANLYKAVGGGWDARLAQYASAAGPGS